MERKTCPAADGVTLVYSAAGRGDIALVFVHGGLADRSFFDALLAAFADRYQVVGLDLAGHGESGANRTKWGVAEFGADVRVVVEAEKLERVVLFGNSLGGPAVIEAALTLGGRVLGVVGIDTFHRLDYSMTAEEARQRADEFRNDYASSLAGMVTALFHADANAATIADAEARMRKTSPETAQAMFTSLAGYSPAAAAGKLSVPLRAINGDLWPTDVDAVRKIKPDFDAVIMKHMGHYPMLERPEEFNRRVADVVAELERLSRSR
jgi:pimeloyl-ACP methyl ester carboxylesterase